MPLHIFLGKRTSMIIGDRLHVLREEKKLSQGDIEKHTGLLRCYISRVENGHTVPTIETLEKMAEPSNSPCTSFSMTERSLPSCRIFPRASRLMKTHGAVQAKMRDF
jgi:transcriptional regulator with XRE-family HTH domain